MYTFYCQFKTGMHMYSEFTVHQEKEERKKERKKENKEKKERKKK